MIPKRFFLYLVAVVAAGVASLPALTAVADGAGKPNVILILADDMALGDLACLNGGVSRTPNLDRLKSESVWFSQATSASPVCAPARAALLTGRYPHRTGVVSLNMEKHPEYTRLHRDETTIADLFRANGYRTGLVGKWHLGLGADYHPLARGFDECAAFIGHLDVPSYFEFQLDLQNRKTSFPRGRYLTDELSDRAIDFVRRHKDTPFFLHLAHYAPHRPIEAPEDRIRRYLDAGVSEQTATVYAMIEVMDEGIGNLLNELDQLKLSERTIVLFASDNGPDPLIEARFNVELRGAKYSANEGGIRVPFMVRWPGKWEASERNTRVHFTDVLPTLVEVCGLEHNPEKPLDGVSFAPALTGDALQLPAQRFWQWNRGRPRYSHNAAVREGNWKLVRPFVTKNYPKQASALSPALYDLSTDPGEATDIAEKYPELTSRLNAALRRWSQQVEQDRTRPAVESVPAASSPHPVDNPTSTKMLAVAGLPADPGKIDFETLPRLEAEHAVLSDVRDQAGGWVHQHAYLAHHHGRYWAMWSDGPGVPQKNVDAEAHRNRVPGHDQAGTRVSYATSENGIDWSPPADLSGPAREDGFGWIARGLWVRDGELLGLATHFKAPGYAGDGLSLESFRWDPTAKKWLEHGTIRDDSMNNFPPKKLPGSNRWMMTRRNGQRQVSVMIGGETSFDDWQIHPMASYDGSGRPEEPYWYVLPDGKSLVGLIRDNGRSGRLLRTFSSDNGRTWSPITRTDFPDATSKFFVLRTSRDYYALVSNSNPKRRDPLTLAISPDGLVFTDLFYLVGGRHIDYPHIIEHNGHLLIAFSGAKQTMEVMRISLDEIDARRAEKRAR